MASLGNPVDRLESGGEYSLSQSVAKQATGRMLNGPLRPGWRACAGSWIRVRVNGEAVFGVLQ